MSGKSCDLEEHDLYDKSLKSRLGAVGFLRNGSCALEAVKKAGFPELSRLKEKVFRDPAAT